MIPKDQKPKELEADATIDDEVGDTPTAALSEAHTRAPAAGERSSGDDEGQTLDWEPDGVSLSELTDASFERSGQGRYEERHLLGKGGMGEVLLCRDRRIGRLVAMKVMSSRLRSKPKSRKRFLREIAVQGQLEHPSVVPIYDMDADPSGNIYFTMKRVRGVTLDEIIKLLKTDYSKHSEKYSVHRLLRAFCTVCQAIEYAHQHGVLHRDLKPANIMLGDYGEVYVLDWGLAKGELESDVVSEPGDSSAEDGEHTLEGSVLGTPGYMAPEQHEGKTEALGPTSDIYSLGAILYQILTQKKLLAPSLRFEIRRSGRDAEARPSACSTQQQIPPELDRICVKASALEPDARYGAVRELHDAVERYLDGERDAVFRKDLAQKHAERAAKALTRDGRAAGASLAGRKQAMREIGRALALDPGNETALFTIAELLTAPPKELPREVQQEIERSREGQRRWTGRVATIAYLSFVLYLPLFLWSGIRSVPAMSIFFGLLYVSGALSFWVGLQRRPKASMVFIVMIVSTLGMASMSIFFGPLVLTPATLAVNTGAFTLVLGGWRRVFAIVLGCLGVFVPVLLQATHWLPSSYLFDESGMVIAPGAIGLESTPTLVLLCVASVATVITSSLSIARVRDSLTAAEVKLYTYAWNVKQLVPTAVPDKDGAN